MFRLNSPFEKFFTIYLSLTLINIFLAHLFSYLCEIFNGKDYCNVIQFEKNDTLIFIFIVSVIIAPIVETFIAQFLVIECFYLFKYKFFNEISIIFISSFLFSLGHFAYGSLLINIFTFFTGLFLAIIYIVAKNRKLNAFWLTSSFHALYNLYAFIITDILKIDV